MTISLAGAAITSFKPLIRGVLAGAPVLLQLASVAYLVLIFSRTAEAATEQELAIHSQCP